MEKTLESMTKWMKDSGKAVNKTKTEVCLFFKPKCRPKHLILNGTRLQTKNVISVFRVQFDSRLHWSQHVVNATKTLIEF
jgi:hypothetical protein